MSILHQKAFQAISRFSSEFDVLLEWSHVSVICIRIAVLIQSFRRSNKANRAYDYHTFFFFLISSALNRKQQCR